MLFEKVRGSHKVTRVRTQFLFLTVEGLLAFFDGVAGLFVVLSVSYLVVSTTVVYNSASLAKKELRFTAANVAESTATQARKSHCLMDWTDVKVLVYGEHEKKLGSKVLECKVNRGTGSSGAKTRELAAFDLV